ncbi:MAG: acyl-CoA dehydrogenase family protein [Rhizobiales bacterium]|nr:acyl-CoA dehydrogenase family protein [Hyphomicrobiales bacterium]
MLTDQASPLSETDSGLIAAAARFADSHVLPHAAAWEQQRVQPAALLREAVGAFSGMAIPVSQGGRGHNSPRRRASTRSLRAGTSPLLVRSPFIRL